MSGRRFRVWSLGRAALACMTNLPRRLILLAREDGAAGFILPWPSWQHGASPASEFGGGASSHKIIETASGHANHALHMNLPQTQMITASSRDRQMRVRELLEMGVSDALRILRDTGGAGLPIHRTSSDDPDKENTLASAIISVNNTGVSWKFYDQSSPRTHLHWRIHRFLNRRRLWYSYES